MDKKKLIGTIIGVTLFAALIAGATFAWLTFNANVTNGSYVSGTMNFAVNFVRGNDIGDVPILSTGTPADAKVLTVAANKVTGSAPGNLTIYLNTSAESSETLLSAEALNYAVCIGTCADFTSAEKGVITSTEKKALITTPLTATATDYNIYFWLDGSKITNDHVGESYSGYISAEAVQTETE